VLQQNANLKVSTFSRTTSRTSNMAPLLFSLRLALLLVAIAPACSINDASSRTIPGIDSTDSAQFTARSLNAAPMMSVLINCGGGNYTDSTGRSWLADTWFTGGSAYGANVPIAATVGKTLLAKLTITRSHADDSPNPPHCQDDYLYSTHRYGAASYAIPAPAGTYTVVFHFAEI
jgi:Malectin domain